MTTGKIKSFVLVGRGDGGVTGGWRREYFKRAQADTAIQWARSRRLPLFLWRRNKDRSNLVGKYELPK
jgi:hypothetical protein